MDHPPSNTEVVKQLVLDLRMKLKDFRKYWKKDFIPGLCQTLNNYFMLKDLKSCQVDGWMLKDKESGTWIMGIPPPPETKVKVEEPPQDFKIKPDFPVERCASCGIRKEDNEEQGMEWSKHHPILCADCDEGNSVFSDSDDATEVSEGTENNLRRPISKVFKYKITMPSCEWEKWGGEMFIADDIGDEIEFFLRRIDTGVLEIMGVEDEVES